jgi:hypothetical protein
MISPKDETYTYSFLTYGITLLRFSVNKKIEEGITLLMLSEAEIDQS